MEPEVYFLKYAFPCSHILWRVRREITEEEYKKMENAAKHNKILSGRFLEKAFWRAFTRIEKLAEEMGKDKWDIEVIKEYFCVRHNSVLNVSDYPESFKEMCKTYKARVIEETNDGEVIVSYESELDGEKKRKVKKDYIKDLKVGERVWIHWQYAVEKV